MATRWLIIKCYWNSDSCLYCCLTVRDSSHRLLLLINSFRTWALIWDHWSATCEFRSNWQIMKIIFHCLVRSSTTMQNGIWRTSTLWMMTRTSCVVGRILMFVFIVVPCQTEVDSVNYNIYDTPLIVSCVLFCFSTQAFSCWYISFKIKGETAEEKVGPFF